MNLIKKIPLPMAGLILGLAAIGNLLQSYDNNIRLLFGGVAAVLYVLYIIKLFAQVDKVGEELNNPLIASVFPTFSMATMLLGGYLYPYSNRLGYYLWFFGVIFHGCLIIWFTMKYVIKFNIKQVFPSWYIVYVGIVVASVTGRIFGATTIATRCFWFGLIAYVILIPIVCYRVYKYPIPEPGFASIAIMTAPGGLLLAGYMNAFETKINPLVFALMIVSLAFYIFVLTKLPKILKLKFYPSISAITFPTVITAIGFKLSNGYLTKAGMGIPMIEILVNFMELVALAMVLYALVQYLRFFVNKN